MEIDIDLVDAVIDSIPGIVTTLKDTGFNFYNNVAQSETEVAN